MLTDYERHLILFSLANAANHFHHDDGEASELVEWLDERKNRTELGIEKNLTKDIRNLLCSKGRQPRMTVEHADPEEMSARQWRGFRQTLREKSLTAGNALYDRTAQRLRDLEGMTGLTPMDVDILEFLLRYDTQPFIESMIDDITDRRRRSSPLDFENRVIISICLGISASSAAARLAANAPLVRAASSPSKTTAMCESSAGWSGWTPVPILSIQSISW